MTIFLVTLQLLAAIALIAAILIQTTKSEQSSGTSGMGWGVIGGKTSSALDRWGLEANLSRLTTYVAIAFLLISMLTAVWYAR
jgi:protein translocase SecG subunit